jgi:hypothetical protein
MNEKMIYSYSWALQVRTVKRAGLFHQQHPNNFYHLFAEIAPTAHYVICKFLGSCTYKVSVTLMQKGGQLVDGLLVKLCRLYLQSLSSWYIHTHTHTHTHTHLPPIPDGCCACPHAGPLPMHPAPRLMGRALFRHAAPAAQKDDDLWLFWINQRVPLPSPMRYKAPASIEELFSCISPNPMHNIRETTLNGSVSGHGRRWVGG